ALRHALRQDPDVLLVGELRDLETMALALTAAETGQLCFATLHTQDAAQTVDRFIDVFPAAQQSQVRGQLANALRGVLSQVLLPRRGGRGRIAARELMLVSPAVATLIRDGKTHMIPNAIETGGKEGMFTMEKALAMLVRQGAVEFDDALARSKDPQRLTSLCARVSA
ncbi:MAG: Flp pilus assembly complex ATPase component TadA, partial [Elusimicrobia bacterium]|nr:Flp pilus assembly complex ATPase component TadA [Elusimicrobiota bacterium]